MPTLEEKWPSSQQKTGHWRVQKVETPCDDAFKLPLDEPEQVTNVLSVSSKRDRSRKELLTSAGAGRRTLQTLVTLSHKESAISARARLSRMKREGRRRQMRVRVPVILAAFVLTLFSLVLWVVGAFSRNLEMVSVGVNLITWAPCILYFSILPSDSLLLRRLLKFIYVPGFSLVTLLQLRDFYTFTSLVSCRCYQCASLPKEAEAFQDYTCWVAITAIGRTAIVSTSFSAIVGLLVISSCSTASTRALKKRLRLSIGSFFVALSLSHFSSMVFLFIASLRAHAMRFVTYFACTCPLPYLILHPTLAARVQSWLISQGEEVAAAAGVAELLGELAPDRLVSLARERFLCVPADSVVEKDMAENVPNPALSELTQKAILGEVDAFISHSWHDDADAKWRALQGWREDFKDMHGREPTFWIDKYCVDQTSIVESLACLPTFLAGCSYFVILCGDTYLDRLWCLVEIVVFLEMGGDLTRLDVRLFRDIESGKVRSNLRSAISDFNPRAARCATKYDTERLQNVLRIIGYDRIGNLVDDVFNQCVDRIDRSSILKDISVWSG